MLRSISLMLLLVSLAWLQYRWTGELSRAERERMEAGLRSSMRRFSEDVGEELVRIFRVFRVDGEEELPDALERWKRESSFPELVENVSVVRGEAPRSVDDDARQHRRPVLSGWPPALVVPIGGFQHRASAAVVLSASAIADSFLAELADRHFGSDFDVVIVDGDGEVRFSTQHAQAEAIVASADQSALLFRPPPPPPPHRRPPPRGFGPRERLEADWRVYVRHRSGSLETAVSRARARNLALSFGVLGLLAASIVLVALSARRAAEAGERKMRFVAAVSHELRTPLAVIRSAAQNLAHGSIRDPSQVERYGELIETEGLRLHRLVEQVLALAGIQSQRPERSHSKLSVRELVSSFTSDVPGSDAFVMGDADALRRAIANLVENANKHGGGAEIVIERRNREVAIHVADRGPGIPAEEIPHLFEAFFRGRGAREGHVAGSGLGLSLVDEIAKEHGARVEVQSAIGRGSRFSLVLPEAGREPAP